MKQAVSGIINGTVQFTENIAENCSSSHFVINRQALAAKKRIYRL